MFCGNRSGVTEPITDRIDNDDARRADPRECASCASGPGFLVFGDRWRCIWPTTRPAEKTEDDESVR